ncbi:MAG TPA: alpha amylase C-terminal domain-containing protein, partial [Chloroflexota bacterium]|nr:alpha amylase C-terminal domain-containing protein [Chloroflexota bacterium]
FLLSSALFWLDTFHLDGFRVDAVAAMIWLDHARPESHWATNRFGGRENLEAVEFLRQFNTLVHQEHPGIITVAEEATSYNWVTQWRTAGDQGSMVKGQGDADLSPDPDRPHTLGFDYKWNMGWMHDTLDYFEEDPATRPEHHNLLTFPIWYAFDERYLLPLSHDEVVHLKKALLTKMPGDDWQRFANLRSLYAYQMSHPGKKLLFMGGEFGQWAEWDEKRSLDWHLMEWSGPGGTHVPLHRGVQRCVADLNRLYVGDPALHALDSRPRGFDWLDHRDYQSSVISFLRRGTQPGQVVVVVCNFTPVVRHAYPVGVPIPGEWHEVLNTDAQEYGGSGVRNDTLRAEHRAPEGRRNAAGVRFGQRLLMTLPPLAVVYLKPGPAGHQAG